MGIHDKSQRPPGFHTRQTTLGTLASNYFQVCEPVGFRIKAGEPTQSQPPGTVQAIHGPRKRAVQAEPHIPRQQVQMPAPPALPRLVNVKPVRITGCVLAFAAVTVSGFDARGQGVMRVAEFDHNHTLI